MRKAYDPKKIEPKWQKFWLSKKTFEAKDKGDKKMILVEFPYPSGAGLHMGHMRPFVAGDVVSKFYKLRGFDVMYPMGWDAFGLPAENFAIKNKVHPSVSTAQNVKNAKKQLISWGTGYDWSREINTTDPEYYKWTQKIFLEFYKSGLAYESTGLINWCPKDKTGLANEEVVDGKCERCGSAVEKKSLRQWYLKITEYAEKLLEGLKHLPEWPEPVKIQQENWIGKSEGAEIDFALKFTKDPSANNHKGPDGKGPHIPVFTTRADTIFGATYLVLAPEHLWVTLATDDNHHVLENKEEVKKYVESVKSKTDIERGALDKEKTGVELKGVKAINPANGEEIPMYIADYVLGGYGTGAIMAVPQHDERDRQFAEKYNLPIVDKPLLPIVEAIEKFGKKITKYKLRDWVFSRQRYWGEPIPLIHCDKCGVVPVLEKDLPVKLPNVKNYEPTGTGESPLAAIDKWVNVKCPECKGKAKRETNTMPQWAGSSWYWLRYMDPENKKEFSNLEKQNYWSPVDLYFGGMEHTTLHLLYSRFWNLMLYDRGLVTVKEPYKKRVPHGIILGPDGEKMSKSRGNVVNPDDVIAIYGADTTRLYMMFLGPHGAQVAWNDKGIVGTRRFLERVWSMQDFVSASESKEVTTTLHKTIKKVSEDIEAFSFNTAVSAMMIFVNTVFESKAVTKDSYLEFIKLLAPFAPHLSEEIWKVLGGSNSVYLSQWPEYKEELLASEEVIIAVQVNGKVRAEIRVPRDSDDETVKAMALKDLKVVEHTENREIRKIIVVKNRLISIVV